MSITVIKLYWTRTFFNIEYIAPNGEELWLLRLKTSQWIRFDEIRNGEQVKAKINIVITCGRQPIDDGEWIICERISDQFPLEKKMFLKKFPYFESIIDHDYRNTLPKRKRNTSWAQGKTEKEGFSFFEKHPYNVQNITFSDEVLQDLESDQRVFRYSGNYALAASLVARANPNDHLFLVLSVSYFEKNVNPKIRKRSIRFREKQVLSLLFKAVSVLIPKRGNHILFIKENGDAPTPNMEAIIKRIYERGLDKQFSIKQRYRDTFSDRQKIHEWLMDIFEIAKADYIFIDDYTPVFNFLKLDRRVVLTQIWHAGVGFKSVGYARFGLAGSPDPYASSHRAYTYGLVGNKYLREIYSEVFGIERKALLSTGMPRLDHFLDEEVIARARESLFAKYPWMKEGRNIVFAPTFRGTGQSDAYYPYDVFFDLNKLYELCIKTNSYFVFEMHHFIKDLPVIPKEYSDRIFDLSKESLMDLYHVSDVLVTDYSSCFYDYLLLNKPVVFYTPDKTEYSATRGFQRSVDEMAPGMVCETFESFLDALEKRTYEDIEPGPSSIDRCIEGGMLASDRVIDAVLLGKKPEGVFLEED